MASLIDVSIDYDRKEVLIYQDKGPMPLAPQVRHSMRQLGWDTAVRVFQEPGHEIKTETEDVGDTVLVRVVSN